MLDSLSPKDAALAIAQQIGFAKKKTHVASCAKIIALSRTAVLELKEVSIARTRKGHIAVDTGIPGFYINFKAFLKFEDGMEEQLYHEAVVDSYMDDSTNKRVYSLPAFESVGTQAFRQFFFNDDDIPLLVIQAAPRLMDLQKEFESIPSRPDVKALLAKHIAKMRKDIPKAIPKLAASIHDSEHHDLDPAFLHKLIHMVTTDERGKKVLDGVVRTVLANKSTMAAFTLEDVTQAINTAKVMDVQES